MLTHISCTTVSLFPLEIFNNFPLDLPWTSSLAVFVGHQGWKEQSGEL